MSRDNDDAPDFGKEIPVFSPLSLEGIGEPSPKSLGRTGSFYMENPDNSPKMVYRIELEDPTLTLYPPRLPAKRLH